MCYLNKIKRCSGFSIEPSARAKSIQTIIISERKNALVTSIRAEIDMIIMLKANNAAYERGFKAYLFLDVRAIYE